MDARSFRQSAWMKRRYGACHGLASSAAVVRGPGVARLMLTHLLPGTDADAATECAARGFGGDIMIARPGGTIEVDPTLQ